MLAHVIVYNFMYIHNKQSVERRTPPYYIIDGVYDSIFYLHTTQIAPNKCILKFFK